MLAPMSPAPSPPDASPDAPAVHTNPMIPGTSSVSLQALRYELVDLATAAQLLHDVMDEHEADAAPEEAIRMAASLYARLSRLADALSGIDTGKASRIDPESDT